MNEWGKFYPRRVIQIGGVELSTQISDIKYIIHNIAEEQKKFKKDRKNKDVCSCGSLYSPH